MRALSCLVCCFLVTACTTSIDFDAGRPYACEPDSGATQCAPGWRCGLEARCHPIGTLGPWRCRGSSDCEGEWTCGLEGVCHDPALTSDYLCATDAGLDDVWCTAPWRCGFAGRCLDVSTQPIDVEVGSASSIRLVSPRLGLNAPDVRVGAQASLVAFARGDRATLLSNGALFDMGAFDAGGEVNAVLPEADETGVVVYAKGAAIVQSQPPYMPLSFDLTEPYTPMLLDGAKALERRGLLSVSRINGPLVTVLPEATAVTRVGECVFLLSEYGLWVQGRFGTPAAAPVAFNGLSHASCGVIGTASERLIMRSQPQGPLLAVAYIAGPFGPVMPDAGVRPRQRVQVFDTSALQLDRTGTGGPLACEPEGGMIDCGDPRLVTRANCTPCGAGDEIAEVRPEVNQVEVVCTGPSGSTVLAVPYDGTCAGVPLGGTSSRYFESLTFPPVEFNPTMAMARGSHGQLWWGSTLASARTLFLDEPALGFFDSADGGEVWWSRTSASVHNAQAGFLVVEGSGVAAVVDGITGVVVAPNGAVLQVDQHGTPESRLSAVQTVVLPNDQVRAVMEPDAGVLAVSVRDQIFVGDRSEWLPRLIAKALPSPGFPIRAMAFEPGGRQLWVATQLGVWQLNEERRSWPARAIPLPAGSVEKVWSVAGHARVAYADGRILTLPDGVPVAAPLETGALADVLEACGQVWGLSEDRVLHVVDRRWEVVALQAPGAPLVLDGTLRAGRLFFRDGELTVFNATGAALRFDIGCR